MQVTMIHTLYQKLQYSQLEYIQTTPTKKNKKIAILLRNKEIKLTAKPFVQSKQLNAQENGTRQAKTNWNGKQYVTLDNSKIDNLFIDINSSQMAYRIIQRYLTSQKQLLLLKLENLVKRFQKLPGRMK